MNVLQFLAGTAASLLLLSPAYASPAPLSGKTITRIVIQDDQGTPWPRPEQLLQLIGVKPGDALAGSAVREGIALLYLNGLFKDIRVEAFPEGNGVRLLYTVVPITFVEKVFIEGNHTVPDETITDGTRSIEGKELRDEKLSAMRSDILAIYQAEGFYETTVTFRIEPFKSTRRVVLHVVITESAPTLIETITFLNTAAFKDKDLLAVMRNKKGSLLRRDVLLDDDMNAVLNKYAGAGYPAARQGPVDISFRDEKAYIRVVVTEGPKVTIRFTGNREFSSDKLGHALLLRSEHSVSDSVIESSADKIKTLYREKGYADVAVEVRKTEAQNALELVFTVREGPRTMVKKIEVRGNAAFTAKELLEEMQLRESGWSSRPFREDLLDKDLDSIRDRYADAGFLSAQIKKSVLMSANKSRAVVVLELAEGPRTRTGILSFDGNRLFSTEELLAEVSLKQGAPYNDLLVDEDRYRVLSAYANKGCLYARVDVEKTSREGVVDVRYRITEDLPVRIGRIILRGNERTKDEVIMRELLVKPGDIYNYKKILSSQQRIYHLGYFKMVKFEPVRPGAKEYVQDMLFTVEERPAGAMEFTVGYGELDRLRASVELSYRNLWGTARYTSIRYEESDILKRGIFNFQEPWFLNRDIEAKFSLVWSDSEKLNSDTRELYYKTRKTSASFGIDKTFGHLTPSITYLFENVRNYDVLEAAQLTTEDSGRVLVSSLNPALVWDLRDDVFNPHRGALYGIVLKEALRELFSEADFSKVTVQGSWFLPVATSVVALSARDGMAWPFRETTVVPLHERFYAGGSTTVRGYTQDSIGPSGLDESGNLIPQGGQSMAIFNIELRIHPGDGLGYVLFTDAGNVWPGQEINVKDLRSSYGAGIRYGTPIGPLRIDYGQKINRRPGESIGEFHFNIGNTF